jgi:hypothetical protein
MQKEELESAIHETFESELVVASAKSIYTNGFINGVRFALKEKGSAVDSQEEPRAIIKSNLPCDYCTQIYCHCGAPVYTGVCRDIGYEYFTGRKLEDRC